MIPVKDVLVGALQEFARNRNADGKTLCPSPLICEICGICGSNFGIPVQIGRDRASILRKGRGEEGSLLNFEAIAGMTNVYCFCHVNRFFRYVFDSIGDTFGSL